MTRQPHNRYSLDGFVPNSQNGGPGGQQAGRHVGFQNASAGQKVRMRRPGVYKAAGGNVAASASMSGVDRQFKSNQTRQAFPEFTPYSSGSNGPIAESGRPTVSDQPASRQIGGQSRPIGRKGSSAAGGRFSRNKRKAAAAGTTGGPTRANWFRRTNWKKVFKRTAAVTAVFLLLGGGWISWQFFKNSNKVFGGDTNVLDFLNTTKLKGEDQGQVNILLAGVSSDDPGHSGGDLTDSIMMISLDTKNNKAFMLSIPRDLWVDIPGYGHSKINAANVYGDEDNFSQAGYPAGGMGLLAKVINDSLELPVHYYAKINYGALKDAVNAVGGITVDIKSTDPRGLYDPNISAADKGPLKLANGPQQLDGQTALNLARARGDPPGDGRYPYGFERSDFTRTEHQRQMVLALKEKVTSGGVVTNPIKIGQLFDVVGKNVKTDFEPGEIRRLYDINKLIKPADIASVSLNDVNGVNMLASYRSPDGASALIPAAGLDDYSQIQLLIKKLMSSDPVVKESATIVILNGGDVTGLASKESNNLTSKGLNVVAVGDAPRQEGANVIIDQSAKNGGAKPGTKARLQQLYKGTVKADTDVGYPTADFIIILGTNQKPPSSGEQE